MNDIKNVHEIDCEQLKGYEDLTDEHKELFAKFIVNFFNGQGLESRATLIPKGVYYVEDYDFIAKEHPEDDFFTVTGGVVLSIDKNGKKIILDTWKDEEYKNLESIQDGSQFYLRFEYEHHGRNEWLHIINAEEWY